MNLLISEYIRTLTYYWSGYLYSNIRYSAKNIQLFEYIWIFNKLWYIFMNEYYSVFHIRKISWPNTIWYSVFEIFLWTNTIRYSVFGNVSWTNTIRYSVFENFSWTNTIRYSVFGNSSWTNIFGIRYSKNFNERILFGIRYSEILHERIYSVFGIRSNSLFGATLPRSLQLQRIVEYTDGRQL